MQGNHTVFMQRCYELAEESRLKGESPVGSLIVLEGKIIAEATERSKENNDISFHAEAEAIRQALKKMNVKHLPDTVLYTTHEPCILCSYMIRHYKIAEVVYAESVGGLGGIDSDTPILRMEHFEKWGSHPMILKYIATK